MFQTKTERTAEAPFFSPPLMVQLAELVVVLAQALLYRSKTMIQHVSSS